MDLRGLHAHLEILVAQQVPQDEVGLPAGFAEDGAVGLAQVLVPEFFVSQGQPPQVAGGHVEFLRGGVPGVPVGAVLRGFE